MRTEAMSRVDAIAEELREDIRTGRLVSGQRLIEADLTERFTISRGPLREALRRLTAEGLVELQHNRGARVRQLTDDEVVALFQVREALEGMAARLAADAVAEGRANPQSLQTIVRRMDRALDQGKIGEYRVLNQQFHDLLMEMGGNDRLSGMARQLQTAVGRVQSATSLDLGAQRAGQSDHRRIAKAITAADGNAAEKAMRAHIRNSLKLNQAR